MSGQRAASLEVQMGSLTVKVKAKKAPSADPPSQIQSLEEDRRDELPKCATRGGEPNTHTPHMAADNKLI